MYNTMRKDRDREKSTQLLAQKSEYDLCSLLPLCEFWTNKCHLRIRNHTKQSLFTGGRENANNTNDASGATVNAFANDFVRFQFYKILVFISIVQTKSRLTKKRQTME